MKNTYELDLLDFQGKPLHLEFHSGSNELAWLFEDSGDDFTMAEGDNFTVELDAELIDTTVRLTGTIRGRFEYTCGRCLEKKVIDLDSDAEFVLMSRPSWREAYEGRDEITLSADDLDVSYYEGEIIDLRPLIREAVLLELPAFPQCSPEEEDACEATYRRNLGDEVLAENEDNAIDLRWAALRDIKLGDGGKDS